jgi:ubiquinone/menaquinone biosynthesis C-methylase UbiE
MGAGRCVGFDLAEEFIAQARELNMAAQLDCEFVAGNAYAIPAAYDGQFDLVYISIGVLSWMPDIQGFFGVVARLLKPQGHLLIYEMHPFLNMLNTPEESDDPLRIALPYFKEEAELDMTNLDYYQGTVYEALPRYWFAHTLAAIMTGLLANGLQIVRFSEYPHDISAIFAPLEPLRKLPLSYILVGEKR